MKKWMVWLLVILILTLSAVYVFIPAKIAVSVISGAQATIHGEFRYLNQEDNWEKWWFDSNGKSHPRGEPFRYRETAFRLTKQTSNTTGIEIDQHGTKIESILHLVSFSVDSTGAVWSFELPETYNPFTRIRHYRMAAEIKKNMVAVLKNFTSFVSIPKNIYGLRIYRTSTRDTTMISTRFVSTAFPTVSELYGYFNVLEKNIQKQKGKKTGVPMMNVRILDDGTYETQVAIPTSYKLENDGNILYRRMVPGNFFGADVMGGQATVNEAQNQLEQFIKDYEKSKMANSYQLLITDRMNEPDTSKWLTKIRIPVVE